MVNRILQNIIIQKLLLYYIIEYYYSKVSLILTGNLILVAFLSKLNHAYDLISYLYCDGWNICFEDH